MDRTAALAHLGLSGSEEAPAITRAYGERLSTMQGRLVSAQTDAEREAHQTALASLVEAYECLTSTGRYTQADANTTLRRAPDAVPGIASNVRNPMQTGDVLSSRLEIGDMLGQGGMGYVYAARDRLRNEDVAIKVLRQDLIFSSAAKERFLAEAKVSSNLSHPNIVRVYDVGESDGHYYLSMERLKGETLRQRMQRYQRDNRVFMVAEVTDIARQLIDALRYAHRYIVHRDLKPENVWLADDGTVKLMDFGIARAYTSAPMTQTGTTLGTAYYMAPEQRLGSKEVDWRADQYALGVMMYELIAGALPMGALQPLNQTRRDVPARFSQAVMRSMSPKPEDRWPSLDAWLTELQIPARQSNKAAVWFIGVLVAAVAGAGVYYSGLVDRKPEQTVTISSSTTTKSGAPAIQSPAVESVDPKPEAAVQNAGPQETPAPGPAEPIDVPQAAAAHVEPKSEQTAPVAKSDKVQTASMTKATSETLKTAAIDPSASRRQECMAQCERDDGECRSITRRGKQECMRAVGFGATGGFTAAPTNRNAECAFYSQARCRYAPDRDACVARIGIRYDHCVTMLTGNVASRRQDCDTQARDADQLCRDELKECRSYCE
jgi:serine/threonine protein kinase